jgi:hypothetical protein
VPKLYSISLLPLFDHAPPASPPFPLSCDAEEGARGQSLETWQCRIPLPHLALFLYLHLPDACSKVHTHPASYNTVWPEQQSQQVRTL